MCLCCDAEILTFQQTRLESNKLFWFKCSNFHIGLSTGKTICGLYCRYSHFWFFDMIRIYSANASMPCTAILSEFHNIVVNWAYVKIDILLNSIHSVNCIIRIYYSRYKIKCTGIGIGIDSIGLKGHLCSNISMINRDFIFSPQNATNRMNNFKLNARFKEEKKSINVSNDKSIDCE